jgi:hypothetical protein
VQALALHPVDAIALDELPDVDQSTVQIGERRHLRADDPARLELRAVGKVDAAPVVAGPAAGGGEDAALEVRSGAAAGMSTDVPEVTCFPGAISPPVQRLRK